jgi:hypothetical protein
VTIQYKDGMKLELWIWDSGELEGFAVYLNGQFLDEKNIVAIKYPIGKPDPKSAIVVEFGGDDGGATKVVDVAANNQVLEHQDSGDKHSYLIVATP